jgi:hypothetical protein
VRIPEVWMFALVLAGWLTTRKAMQAETEQTLAQLKSRAEDNR